MAEQTVEELVESYSRRELDDMAESLGLNSADYPNKASIAQALLKARREKREREMMERQRLEREREREREARIQELKKKMTEDTVKGKIAAIKATAEKMQKNVAALQSGIKEQMKENVEAVTAIQSGVQDLMNKYQAFSKDLQSRVAAMQADIKEQMNENQIYVKNFYG